MLSFRSTKRTNWQIQWVDLSLFFFLHLWSIWQCWSHSPFWTFETLFSLILCPNSLPVLLLLWLFLLSLFCKQSSFPVPTLEFWCQKKNVDVCQGSIMALFSFYCFSWHICADDSQICLEPKSFLVSRPKYPTSCWTAPLAWLKHLKLSVSNSLNFRSI